MEEQNKCWTHGLVGSLLKVHGRFILFGQSSRWEGVFDDNQKIFFLISHWNNMSWPLIRTVSKNICCGPSSDLTRSDEGPQHMFLWRIKQNYRYILSKSPFYLELWIHKHLNRYLQAMQLWHFHFGLLSQQGSTLTFSELVLPLGVDPILDGLCQPEKLTESKRFCCSCCSVVLRPR